MTSMRQQIMSAASGFSIETTPASAAKVAHFGDHLAPGTTVNVTYLAGSNAADTINVCRRLRDEGMKPVPHVAARNIESAGQLDDYLGALTTIAGVDEALVIAGGLDRPAGPYDCTMQVLNSGLFQKHGIRRIAVAGHPEGSPDINDQALAAALADKNQWATENAIDMYIETQFCFEADVVLAWEQRIRDAGNQLPIHIGVPGPATLKTLLKFAQMSGVGPSMRVLTRQARNLTKLVMVQAPDRLITHLADAMANDEDCLITGLHMYPFGGMAKTSAWINAVAEGHFDIHKNHSFTVTEPLKAAL